MICKQYSINTPAGFHARIANAFVNKIRYLESQIRLKKGTVACDAKSILGILSMQAIHNTEVTVEIEGPDECEAETIIHRFFTKEMLDL